jgi:glutathione S-transferase
MIKLYGIPASRASRCLWMLEELGVKYQNVPTSFIGDVHKPDYLKLNPNGHIPTLDDDGLILWESLAINLHLARKYGKGTLWPDSEDDQSRAIQWSIWAMTEAEPPVMEVLVNRAFAPEPQRDESKAKAGETKLQKPAGVLDGHLAGRDFMLGSRFTVADLNVHAVLGWTVTLGKMSYPKHPNLSRWLAACGQRPALGRVFKR